MSDDILDAAQKAINDAAKGVSNTTNPVTPTSPSPAASPLPEEPAPMPPSPSQPSTGIPLADIPSVAPTAPSTPVPPPSPPIPNSGAHSAVASSVVDSMLQTKQQEPVVPPPTKPEAAVKPTEAPPKQSKVNFPPKKSGKKPPIAGIIIGIIMIIGIGAGALYVANPKQLADIRSSAKKNEVVKLQSDRAQKQFADARINDAKNGTNTAASTDVGKWIVDNANSTDPTVKGWIAQDQADLGKQVVYKNPDGTTTTDSQYDIIVNKPPDPIDEPKPRDDNGGGGGNNTIVPTDTPAPSCANIKIYASDGTTQVTPSSLHQGDHVVIAVTANMTADKARFRANGQPLVTPPSPDPDPGWTDSTTVNSKGEFTALYTMAAATAFQIEAEVHINGAWY